MPFNANVENSSVTSDWYFVYWNSPVLYLRAERGLVSAVSSENIKF